MCYLSYKVEKILKLNLVEQYLYQNLFESSKF